MSLDSTFAVLDACVLLPPRLSDVPMDCRAEGLFSAHWTEEIGAEYLRNMQGALGYPEAAAARRLVAMERRCPEWSVPAWRAKLPSVPGGVDAKDQHVAAAALALRDFLDLERIAAEVFVVTENTRHLATKAMKRLGVDVVRPGRFLDLMYGQDPDKVHSALRRAVEDLRDPPYSMEQLLDALEFHGAHGLVKGASKALGIAPDEVIPLYSGSASNHRPRRIEPAFSHRTFSPLYQRLATVSPRSEHADIACPWH